MTGRGAPEGPQAPDRAETSHLTAQPRLQDVRHALHSSLFAIDVAVGNMAQAQDPDERASLVRAVRRELEQVHALVRRLGPAPREPDTTGAEPPT